MANLITKQKVALCMRGAISKVKGRFEKSNDLYCNSEYVDYEKCYKSIVKHILLPNIELYDIDIFCHCWNVDLEENITKMYNPCRKSFENNQIYNDEINKKCVTSSDFGGISQALTIKKSIELMEEYELEKNIEYDMVILYRYDIFLWKDMNLSNYNKLNDTIYVNAYADCNGDFHFIMNSAVSKKFKNLYDSVELGNNHILHYWIKNYIQNYMKINICMDNIKAGTHQEVIRQIVECSISRGNLNIEDFNKY
jgi:hypothetical protein